MKIEIEGNKMTLIPLYSLDALHGLQGQALSCKSCLSCQKPFLQNKPIFKKALPLFKGESRAAGRGSCILYAAYRHSKSCLSPWVLKFLVFTKRTQFNSTIRYANSMPLYSEPCSRAGGNPNFLLSQPHQIDMIVQVENGIENLMEV